MSHIKLDSIVRSAIANKGHSTLHLYVPYLHWAFEALRKFQQEGFYTDVRSTKEYLNDHNALPFPSNMLMWNKFGIVSNGRVHVYVNDNSLSLDPLDHTAKSQQAPSSLFSYDSTSLDWLYTSNIYVSTGSGAIAVGLGNTNSFKVNWAAKEFQLDRSIGDKQVYLEWVAKAHDPTTETLVLEIAQDYIIEYIYYREARFKFGAAARETQAAERDWLNAEDDLAASTSDLTANGLINALTISTRKTIDQ